MSTFKFHKAKAHLSRLLDRRPGRLKGRIRIGPDFDDPLPEEILAVFRGEENEAPLDPPSPDHT